MSFQNVVYNSNVPSPCFERNNPSYTASSKSVFSKASEGLILEMKKYQRSIKKGKTMVDALGSPADSLSHRSALHAQIDLTRSLERIVRRRLVDLPSYCISMEAEKLHRGTFQRWAREVDTHTHELDKLVAKASEKERTYPVKVSSTGMDQCFESNLLMDCQYAGDRGDKLEKDPPSAGDKFRRLADGEMELNAQLIDETDEEIAVIHDGMVEMNKMFKEVSKHSASQSDFIDDIESRVEATRVSVGTSVKMLQKASVYQATSCRLYTAVLLFILCSVAGICIWVLWL